MLGGLLRQVGRATSLSIALALLALQSMPLPVLHDLHAPRATVRLTDTIAQGTAWRQTSVESHGSGGCSLCEMAARGRASVLPPLVEAPLLLAGVEHAALRRGQPANRERLGPAEPRGPPTLAS